MKNTDGQQEDDHVVLERLLGMKQEWLDLEAEIRNKAAELQKELTQEKKEKEGIANQLNEARKECDELNISLQRRDKELAVSCKQVNNIQFYLIILINLRKVNRRMLKKVLRVHSFWKSIYTYINHI